MQIPVDSQGQAEVGPQGVLWGDGGPADPSPWHTLNCSACPCWTRGTAQQPEHSRMVFALLGIPHCTSIPWHPGYNVHIIPELDPHLTVPASSIPARSTTCHVLSLPASEGFGGITGDLRMLFSSAGQTQPSICSSQKEIGTG